MDNDAWDTAALLNDKKKKHQPNLTLVYSYWVKKKKTLNTYIHTTLNTLFWTSVHKKVTLVDTTAHITLYPVQKQSVTGQVVSNEPDPQNTQSTSFKRQLIALSSG